MHPKARCRRHGGAYTRAVLGTHVKEVHLCSEGTTVPIVEALVEETEGEVTIHLYERQTPRIIQNDNSEGDSSRVQKGDCLVTFSRSEIFGMKIRLEELPV